MDLSSGKWIQRERDQIKDPIFCSYYIINKNRILSNFDYFFFCTTKYLIVGSLASEFLGWSWKTYVGIPMMDIGIPTSEFQCPT